MSRLISDFQGLPIDKMHRRKVIQSIKTHRRTTFIFPILKKMISTDIMTTQEAWVGGGGGGGCWETGVLSGKNDILQNWKIRFVFLYIPICWITFLPCILSTGNLWKSEIGRDSVLLINYQIFFLFCFCLVRPLLFYFVLTSSLKFTQIIRISVM